MECAWFEGGAGETIRRKLLELIEENGVFPAEFRSPGSKVDENDIVFFKTKITVLHEIQLLKNHSGADDQHDGHGELSDNQNSPET